MHNRSTPASLLIKKQAADAFEAEDCTDDRFYIAGKVRSGVLEYVIVTKILSTSEKSSIPAADDFGAMMSHYLRAHRDYHQQDIG